MLGGLTGFLLALVLGGMLMLDRAVSAPGWLRSDVEARLAEALPGFRVGFGDVQVLVQRNGLARVILLDVDVETARGGPVATLSDVEIGLSPRALLQGRLDLRELDITGAFVTLRRKRDGALGLAIGDAFAADGLAPDIPTLVRQVDRLLDDPRLARLRQLDADALTLRYEDARAHRGWTVDGGRLRLERDRGRLRLSGDFALLGGGATATTLQLNADSRIGEAAVNFGFVLRDMPSQDIATQGPALAWLGALRAPISGALRARMRGDGTLGTLNATLQIGAGAVQPGAETTRVPFAGARSYFTYDPARGTIRFSEVSVRSDLGEVTAEGQATLRELRGGVPAEMLGQFTLTSLSADPGTLFAAPLSIARAEMDFRLRLDPFQLDLGRLWIDDPDLPVRMRGRLSADREAWHYALAGGVERMEAARLAELWPLPLAPKTRAWFLENVHAGTLRDGQFALRSRPADKPQAYLSAQIDGAEVTYARTLPALTGGAGSLVLDDRRFAVRAEAGEVTPPQGGAINIAGTSFVVPDTRQRPARGELRLAGEGRIEALLSYLDSPRLELLSKAGRGVDLAEGRIRFGGSLDFPLRKGLKLPDLDFELAGTARGLRSTAIVPDRVLSARALEVAVNRERLRVSGRAELDGIALDGSWTMPLPEPGGQVAGSVVEADVTLSDAAARAIGIDLPPGMISGRGSGRLRIDLARGAPPSFTLASRLDGLALAIPQIGWRLAEGQTGVLRVEGALARPARIDLLRLDAPGLEARGDVTLAADGSFARMDLERVRAGAWLDAPVTLRGRGRGVPPAIELSGGQVDLRAAPFGGGSGAGTAGGAGVPIRLALDSLQISSGIVLRDFRAELTSGAGLSGSFTGSVGGSAPISGQAVPQRGGTAFRITSRDAARVIRAAGILKTVSGGAMELTLVPVAGRPGTYDGALDITDIRLRNAPGIAALLDAISIVGLLDQLEGPGIFFGQVEARFRLTPEQLILTRSSATGPSMGVSMDGVYNLASSTLDMQGVLSPIFFLNGIGSILTRKGEGLIGFNFNLRGPAADPRVAVNPLSMFTPGMFREIFRRPPPTPGQ